ncbi:aminotransferase class I/II-fold pyridoxal phosphate-dependent enzyme [Pelagicoccus sp. NFK12]|uniref:Aminotransferase class I/II-fold pyridoxal phosphate-dependent enzyme n=1 Tax=Pelagicoccus enzymogenes TaxID=2773457 RepID=A0A927F9W6_9BACT|nr:aminotransferase class I/II-fold pyridoxal phosphate-dependent enzyme [Pelagicoccus enzymogenes]MBD5780529.1 aminotransferase class I/II-fold pyridoxal phosphate-dependent enzyme [Pelagicoccus enzymogenes]
MNRRDWIKSASIAVGAACVSQKAFAQDRTFTPIASSHGFTNLSINENQFGPSIKAISAIRSSLVYANEYPLEAQEKLKKLIAQREDVAPSQVILGAGSSDITMGAAGAFSSPGQNMVSSDPSFHPLMLWAEKFGVEHVKVPWTSDYQVDLTRIEESITEKTSLAYVCNPENPVGTLAQSGELYAFCKSVSEKCPVLVDEAYIDYAGDVDKLSMMRCVREGLPVIVLRTFSKAYGLGGMRVGYAVTSPELAAKISRYYVTGIGCGCSHTSLEAAIAAYQDQEWLAAVRRRTAESRDYLCKYYDSIGQFYIPSVTTFVLAPTKRNSQMVADAIFGAYNLKISPRKYFGQDYLRISMGTMEQMNKLTDALSFVL